MEKKDFLNNIEDLSAQQLADGIIQGIVTLEELRATNNLDNTKRKAVVKIIAEKENEIIAVQTQKDKEPSPPQVA